jgi:hypothetical protein
MADNERRGPVWSGVPRSGRCCYRPMTAADGRIHGHRTQTTVRDSDPSGNVALRVPNVIGAFW